MFSLNRLWGILIGVPVLAAVGIAFVPWMGSPTAPPPPPAYRLPVEEIEQLRKDVHDLAVEWVAYRKLFREDGYTYSGDVAMLMLYAARQGDRLLFNALKQIAVSTLIVTDPMDPLTFGFALHRATPSRPRESCAAIDTLRFAKAFWEGHEVFGHRGDRDMTLVLLRAYARFAGTEQGQWLVRSSYDLRSRSFAGHSLLTDHDPDFVARVAFAVDDAALKDLAAASHELVRRAVAPCGLIYDVVQPLLGPALAGVASPIFSPNDVVSLDNSCATALAVAQTFPQISARVLAFAYERQHDLRTAYLGRTGDPAAPALVSMPTHAALTRLSAKHGDRSALSVFAPAMLKRAHAFAENPGDPHLRTAADLLMTLQTLQRTP